MKKSPLILFLNLLIGMAFAFPPLQPFQQGSVSINLPVSWQIQIDESRGMIYIREDPNNQNSAEIFLISGPNQNNVSPKSMIEQAMQNIKDQGFANMTLQDSQELPGGLMAVISGDKQGVAYKAAFVSFVNQNMISLAGFSTTANHFDELGGAALIFVTVGGQDPANYGSTNPIANQTANNSIDPECNNPNMDIIYNTDYCKFNRAMASRQKVDPSYLIGSWSEAVGLPMQDSYKNTQTGEISYDSMGHGISIIFHNNGSYELLRVSGSTSAGCVNTIKSYEKGNYSFDGLNLQLANGQAEVSSSFCGGPFKPFTERVVPETASVVFVDANHVYIQLNCNARSYMQNSVSCNGYGQSLVSLTRGR